MTLINKWYAGEDFQGCFIGVVESRQDPLELGRIQVRIYGVHNPSLTEIPSADLPWATVVQGLSGKQFSTPKESDVVIGFWLDGSKQLPCVFGVLPGIETNKPDLGSGFHDLRAKSVIANAPKKPISRQYNTDGSGIVVAEANTADPNVLENLRHPNVNELNQPSISGVGRYEIANTVIQDRKSNLDKNVYTARNIKWSEPYPAYNPEYPYDIATETESGHVFELDDTPGSERIHIAHRTGSYVEWFPSGTKVEKITKSNYQIIMGDDHLHVMGSVLITVDGDAFIRVKGDVTAEVGNSLSANVAGDTNFSIGGDFNVKATNINFEASDDITMVSASQHYTSSGSMDITGQGTNISSGSDLNLQAGGDANLEGGGSLNLLASGQAALTGSSVGISGGVQIDGLESVNHGAPTAGGAGSAASGTAKGLPGAITTLTKNTGEALPEEVPVPFDITRVTLDATTGTAYVQQQFLVPGANNKPIPPDANNAAQPCMFDASTKIFISDPNQWFIGQSGLAIIKAKEGFAKVVSPDTVTAYPDPATGGEPYTIGYGTTASAINQPVTLGELISRATAESYLEMGINNEYLPALRQSVSVPLTQNMIDACLSLIYNIGPNNFIKSTLRKRINEQNWCAAGDAFLSWNKAAGKEIPGLTTRRKQERQLFLS